MIFFYFVLESALLATQRTSPQEYAVRFSQKSDEIFKNIWKFIDFKFDQIHTYYIFNLTKNMFRAQFFRKHEKFFENKIISISTQFQNKQFIRTRHETQIKTTPKFSVAFSFFFQNIIALSTIYKFVVYFSVRLFFAPQSPLPFPSLFVEKIHGFVRVWSVRFLGFFLSNISSGL